MNHSSTNTRSNRRAARRVGFALALASFVVGGIGLIADSMTVFWIGVALTPIAVLVGYVMARMGYHTGH